MRDRRRLVGACLLLLLLTAFVPAQVPAPGPPAPPQDPLQSGGEELELNADLVLVSAVVTKASNSGKLIRNLTASDFTILDNGVPQEVAFFGDETTPLDVIFLFDASDSTQFRQQFQREALSTFLRTLLRPNDSAAVYWFTNQVHVEQDFTSDPRALLSAISRIPSGGATALYAGIGVASGKIAARAGRRAIVVLSDGRDTFSSIRLDEALQLAQRADAVIFGVNPSFAKWGVTPEYKANDPLEYLASETGGEVYYTAKPDDVEDVLSRLSGRLRERYVLGFYPTAQDAKGSFHRLTVRVNRKNTRVESRTGYFSR